MSKKKHIRVRRLTYSQLAEAAEDQELAISELADRVLSDYVDAYEGGEERGSDDDEEGLKNNDDDDDDNDLDYSCPSCDAVVLPGDQVCTDCEERLDFDE